MANDWVEIDTAVMRKARNAKGLSYESAGHALHVSGKTYERRKKDGRWPKHDVEQLAQVLGLDIERPPPLERVSVAEEVPADLVARLEAVADQLAGTARELTALVKAQALPPVKAARPRR